MLQMNGRHGNCEGTYEQEKFAVAELLLRKARPGAQIAVAVLG